ncbi:MAG: OprO/OprP family phosphate-selective porin [Gammaproteobacteria bacterium]
MLKSVITPVFSLILTAGLMVSAVPAAHASNETMLELLKILRDKGSISDDEYSLLRNTALADEEQQMAKQMKQEKMQTASKSLPKITTKGKLEFDDREGNKFKIGGRLQSDYSFSSRDGGFQDESRNEFARARLYLSGTAFKDFDFKFQYDFEDLDDNSQGIEDAYIRYTGFDSVDITIGQRKAPYSLSELTSSKYIAFIDRSFVADIFNESNIGLGNRNPGITFTAKPAKNTIVEGGFYTLRQNDGGSDSDSIAPREINDGHGITGRIVYAPLYDKRARQLVSVGLSGGYRNYPNGGEDGIGNIDADGNSPLGRDIIDSESNIYADSYTSFNLNLAAQYERFWLSGEYFQGSFDLAQESTAGTGLDADSLSGYYIQGGVFLTDDSRGYKNGAWDKVNVSNPVTSGGIGAWEMAIRFDQAELEAALADNGIEQDPSAFTFALNWYPITNIRLQANYVSLFCGDVGDCDFVGKPDIFALRTQIFF